MTVRPERLNAAVAWLFMVGSACFVVGSVPAYLNAVGGSVDGVTYFVGSIFFTDRLLAQLVQAQTPAMTDRRRRRPARPGAGPALGAGVPHDRELAGRGHPVSRARCSSTSAPRRPDPQRDGRPRRTGTSGAPTSYGSTLFLVSSAFAVLAVWHGSSAFSRGPLPWRIAWLNMLGSILFMASAMASYVLPDTDDLLSARLAVAGTCSARLCFLIGAALMFPAWRRPSCPPSAATST